MKNKNKEVITMNNIIGIKFASDDNAAICEVENGKIINVATCDWHDAIMKALRRVDVSKTTTIITELSTTIEIYKKLKTLDESVGSLKATNSKFVAYLRSIDLTYNCVEPVNLIGLTYEQWRSAYYLPTALRSDANASIDQVMNLLDSYAMTHIKKNWLALGFDNVDAVENLSVIEAEAILLAFTEYNTVLADYNFVKTVKREELENAEKMR